MPQYIPDRVVPAKSLLDVVAAYIDKTDANQVRLISWSCLKTIALQIQLVLQNRVSGIHLCS